MRKRLSGFTLLELLLAIGIVAVMVGFVVITFPGTQIAARDTKRKSDLKQFQQSLETFANRSNNFYPHYSAGSGMANLCTTLTIAGTCQNDPRPPAAYTYISAGGSGAAGSASAISFVIYATMEKQFSGLTHYWVVCSNGNVGRVATSSWTPSSTCPANLVP